MDVLLMHSFLTLQYTLSRPSQKLTSSTVMCLEMNVILVTLGRRKTLLWNRRFQNLPILHAFARHYSKTKTNKTFRNVFPKFSSDKMTLCNNKDQTWFSDTLTSARPLRGSLKPSPFRLGGVSTPPLGSKQMTMHRKTCLIPILKLHPTVGDRESYTSNGIIALIMFKNSCLKIKFIGNDTLGFPLTPFEVLFKEFVLLNKPTCFILLL